jgi:hypothetical protein
VSRQGPDGQKLRGLARRRDAEVDERFAVVSLSKRVWGLWREVCEEVDTVHGCLVGQ